MVIHQWQTCQEANSRYRAMNSRQANVPRNADPDIQESLHPPRLTVHLLSVLFQQIILSIGFKRQANANTQVPGLSGSRQVPVQLFADLVLNHPEDYHTFVLVAASLCHTTALPYHESVLLEFQDQKQGECVWIVADRVVEHTPREARRRHMITPLQGENRRGKLLRVNGWFPQDFTSRSSPYSSIPAEDFVRRLDPLLEPTWLYACMSDIPIVGVRTKPIHKFPFDQPGMTQLTLVNVALVLHSVSLAAPTYSFDTTNCWWFAHCALLLLSCLAKSSYMSRESIEKSFFDSAPTTNLFFPGTINNGMIQRDTGNASIRYNELVSALLAA